MYGRNPRNIGIAFLGDYGSSRLTDPAVNSVKSLIHFLNDTYGVAAAAGGRPYVTTHRELTAGLPRNDIHARPDELLGVKDQTDAVEAWSRATLPNVRKP